MTWCTGSLNRWKDGHPVNMCRQVRIIMTFIANAKLAVVVFSDKHAPRKQKLHKDRKPERCVVYWLTRIA